MTFATSPGIARLAPRLRAVTLTLFALLVAHDAIYVAQFGLGDSFATAMAERGHDGYWLPFTLVVGVAAVAVFLASVAVLGRLEHRRAPSAPPLPGPSYLHELSSTWLRLFPTVALLFAAQENLEHLLHHGGHLVGLAPLGGSAYPLALPVLALTTFVLAALGSLLRWRIRLLAARIAAARARHPRPLGGRPAREWLAHAAAIPHRWMLDRRDAGRAPPELLVA